MVIQDDAIPGWAFEVDEVSAGVYLVIGTDREGRRVEKKGLDPDTLVEECKRAAREMDAG